MPEPIPGPKGLPLVGNIMEMTEALNSDLPLDVIMRTSEQYGGVFKLQLGSKRQIFVTSAALAEELLDERRFIKQPPAALQLTKGAKGLFAARGDDPDWGQGHRILLPAMGPLKVEQMFEGRITQSTSIQNSTDLHCRHA